MRALIILSVLLVGCSNPPPTKSVLTCKVDGDTVYKKESVGSSWMNDRGHWRTRNLNNYYKQSVFESCSSENFYE